MLGKYADLINFQLNIAVRWDARGSKTDDVFSKFFFYFAGFNALYFLWKEIDKVKGNEVKQIGNLIGKFRDDQSAETYKIIEPTVEYFCGRQPVQRMDKRKCGGASSGEASEGCVCCDTLLNADATTSEKIKALAQIIYQVRSNLVHGSKSDEGDDENLVELCILPLKTMLKISIDITRESLKGDSLS